MVVLRKQMENNVAVVVMTEKQVELLRKQIAAYATISEQLLLFHKRFSSSAQHQDSSCCSYYPSSISSGLTLFESPDSEAPPIPEHRMLSARQRWSPSPMQLEILENLFDGGERAPSKGRISEITAQLEEHGEVKTSNVYNWFQNRRARNKRKLRSSEPPNKDARHCRKRENVSAKTSLSPENISARSEEIPPQISEMNCDAHLDVATVWNVDSDVFLE